MDIQQCRLYIQWCQSERVELLVGGLFGPTERFLVPRELLLRRSRTFRDLLEQQAGELSSKVIQLPNTPVQTMEAFFVWTFSPQPHIDERATFSEVVRLGIFAWRYQISALSNQVTDIIRSNLANGHWQLQASMVDDIYSAVPTGSPLREVIRAALGGLLRSSVEGEGRVREEWKATFLKHAQLGWDYCEAGGSGWTSGDYLSGTCRFHDHQGVPHQEELFVFGNQCVYAREECFPRWEEERDGEQERCGADEEEKEGKLNIEAVVNEAEEPVMTEAMEATEAVEAVVDDVATEAVVNGVAETIEAEVDDVTTEAVVNGVVAEAAEAEVDDVATEAVEAEVDGVATEAVVHGMATETVVDGVATEAVEAEVDVMATEAVVNGATTEAVVDGMAMEVEVDVVATEAVVDGVTTEAVVDDLATEEIVATESVVDGAEGPVAMEALVIITEERVDETVVEKATESKNEKTEGKRKAKKKRGGGR